MKEIPTLKQSTIEKHEVKQEPVNYSQIKRERTAAGTKEPLVGVTLTEEEMRLCIKALTIASRSYDKLVQDNGPLLTREERNDKLTLASQFNDLSKKLQSV